VKTPVGSRRLRKSVVAVGVTISVWLALGLPASARWAYGNGPTDLDVITNGGENRVCFNRIKGRAGAHGFGDPETFNAPPGPYGTRTVQVFASDESLDGSEAEPGGLRRIDGVLVPPAASQTTGQLQELDPYESFEDFGGDTFSVYAAASFNIVPASGSVDVGDYIAVKIQGRSAYLTTLAADCEPSSK